MVSPDEFNVLLMCVEWFLYGKMICVLTCTLAKQVQLFPGLGIYSGIFAIYLHYALTRRKESRTTTVVFYALCLLYFLSTATVVSDLLVYIVEVSNNSIRKKIIFFKSVIQMRIGTLPVQLQDNSQSTLIRVSFVEIAVNGCSDFIAQCTLVCNKPFVTYHLFYSPKSAKIYRCWIVWGKNTRVVIIPSFLAITYIGQRISSFDKPDLNLSLLVTWIASEGAETFVDGEPITALWGVTLVLTGLATSMVVNALVTGLIAFKILKVFLEVKATSVERTLGSLSSTAGGPKLRHIIFIIIESGMALFAIQLVRVVISIVILLQVQGEQNQQTSLTLPITLDFVIAIHEMLNVITRSCFIFYIY